jgi:FkbM family methyltransferase
VKKRISKALFYYKREGATGLAYAILRSVLLYPRRAYRTWRWRRFMRQEDDVVNLPGGLRLRLNRQDAGLSVELAAEGTHEPILTNLLERLIRKGATVVDVGANLGYFALVAARATGESGKVIALEPSPVSYRLLLENVQLNKATNVYTRIEAAGDRPGEAALYLFREANWNSLLDLDEGALGSVIVPVLALDDLLAQEQRVDLVRMDVEGYEGRVLGGMRRVLQEKKPLIVAEIHALSAPEDFAGFFRILSDFDYEILGCYPRMKDQVYWGRPLAKHDGLLEKPALHELVSDRRLVEFKEDFTALFQHKSALPGPDLRKLLAAPVTAEGQIP